MKVTILGTGAMACLIGARLAPHAEVTLLGTWEEALAAIRRQGIRVVSDTGTMTTRVDATDNPGACVGSQVLIVMVKAWQTGASVGRARGCLAPSGLALTLQNGIGNHEILQAVFGPERAAVGVTTMGATLLSPGVIRLGGAGTISLGRHPGIDTVQDLFRAARLEVGVVPDVQSLQWGKLVINASINPLAAILRQPNGEILRRDGTRLLLEGLAREAAQVARSSGIHLPYPDAAAEATSIAERTAGNRSSMLQDVEHGRPTEIDAINGAVVRQAERLGQSAHLNWAVWQLVRSLHPQPAPS